MMNSLGEKGFCEPKVGLIFVSDFQYMDVGQNGRPRGPQMEMSSLVLTIHNFGVPNFDPYLYSWLE